MLRWDKTIDTANMIRKYWAIGFATIATAILAALSLSLLSSTPAGAVVRSLSTGTNHACAVVDRGVKCWGSGASGQLGNKSTAIAASPVSPYIKEAWTESVRECTGLNIFGSCIGGAWVTKSVNHAQTALYGKSVSKVSAGYNHTCALASARVYCWGNNDSGQLGNRTNNDSNQPVLVDIASMVPAKPGYCNGSSNRITGCGFPTGTWVNEVPAVPASALAAKEVIDISAGYYFTCALASDGTVACWGRNSDGQLGNESRNNANYPVAVTRAAGVPMKPGYCNGTFNSITGCAFPTGTWVNEVPAVPASALQNKTVKKLAKVSGEVNTMCVITTEDKAVCWGQNDVGQVGTTVQTPKYSSATSSHRVNNNNQCRQTNDTALNRAKNSLPDDYPAVMRPTNVNTNLTFTSLVITGSGDRSIDTLIDSIGASTSVHKTTEGAVFVSAVVAAPAADQSRIYYWGGSLSYIVDLDCKSNGNMGGSQCPGPNGERTSRCDRTKTDVTIKRAIFPKPETTGPLYTSDLSNGLKGQKVVNQAGNAMLGVNSLDNKQCVTYTVWYIIFTETREICSESTVGMSCAGLASNSSSVHCDTAAQTCTDNSDGTAFHIGILKALGQYRQTCQFNGPQSIASGDASWLKPGMTITQQDVGSSKFACAVANDESIGCWGEGTKGQLGNGTKNSSSVPVKVGI